jgi:hypothetical protein
MAFTSAQPAGAVPRRAKVGTFESHLVSNLFMVRTISAFYSRAC